MAISVFEWVYETKIVNGRAQSLLVPKGTAIRAEFTTIIMRLENIYEI